VILTVDKVRALAKNNEVHFFEYFMIFLL